MRPDRLLPMLCLTTGLQTFSIGAFPALLPELGRSAALADWQLGAVAGAFGFARMLADLPAGLLMTHHVRRALIAGPAFVLAGVTCLVLGSSFGWLVLGRVLMGTGHTLGTLGALTTILRVRADRLASALSAVEFSAMLGILGGVTLVGALPRELAWQTAFLVACSPILVALVILKALLVLLPDAGGDRPWFARSAAAAEAAPNAADRGASALAFAAGGAVALAYATLEQYVIPVRGSREFGLERSGIARLLMVAQLCDTVALLPVGALADRRGTARVLGVVLLTFAAAVAMIGLGPLPLVVAGCVVFGLSMAGWMLPVGLLRAATPASQVAWRTVRFRVFVDGGMFLGPLASGLLGAAHPRVLPAALSALLLTVGVALLARRAPH
ncbi:MAG TPA: MFS transporter [Patescibacteria group bacterium]|nr:MFS transporter [Patescibacteria group bacterium]